MDCDFVVLVALNRGYRYGKKKSDESGLRDPDFYVFPVEVVKTTRRAEDAWKKTYMRDIADADQYRDRWDLISKHLS